MHIFPNSTPTKRHYTHLLDRLGNRPLNRFRFSSAPMCTAVLSPATILTSADLTSPSRETPLHYNHIRVPILVFLLQLEVTQLIQGGFKALRFYSSISINKSMKCDIPSVLHEHFKFKIIQRYRYLERFCPYPRTSNVSLLA